MKIAYQTIAVFVLFASLVNISGRDAGVRVDYEDPVRALNGMVVSAQVDASEAGVEVLRKGGNAIDAAVATGFALAVTYPGAGNVGGGGFMVIRLKDGTTTSIDYREKAPGAATRDMYLDENGDFLPNLSQRGYLASGVPGSVAGLLLAHEKYGKLSRKEVMAPALRLAKKGYILSRRQAITYNNYYNTFSQFESTKKYFTKGDSTRGYQEGERFKQRDLYKVLKRISKQGRDGFYTGKTADLIVAEMERGGGIITHQDLRDYQAVEREPIVGEYRGHKVYSMPPASSGGIALVQLLNAVEPYNIKEMGFNSSATIHLMGESMRRVYADRAEWLGDSDYFDVPIDELIDKDYMQRRMAGFNPDSAGVSEETTFGNPFANESTETTHYSVVDSEGNAVSTTTTINSGFGSKVVIDGAGFFMNNEMDDFSAKPGVPNQFGLLGNEANAIEPGKRMLSAMTPTIVEDKEGKLKMVIGTPGGSTIITTVFQTIMNVIDHEMDIASAVSSPRVHHQWFPDVMFYENGGLAVDVVDNLKVRGWDVVERRGTSGRADGIVVQYNDRVQFVDEAGLDEISSGKKMRVLLGGADPRGEDIAVGY